MAQRQRRWKAEDKGARERVTGGRDRVCEMWLLLPMAPGCFPSEQWDLTGHASLAGYNYCLPIIVPLPQHQGVPQAGKVFGICLRRQVLTGSVLLLFCWILTDWSSSDQAYMPRKKSSNDVSGGGGGGGSTQRYGLS